MDDRQTYRHTNKTIEMLKQTIYTKTMSVESDTQNIFINTRLLL